LSESEIRSLDFSEDLGVIKWEAPIPSELDGEVVGAMPTEISSTSQDRIQNLPDVLCSYAETEFEASIKLDGESMTVFRTNSNNGVCSKSWWYEEADDNALWSVAKKNNLIPALNSLGRNLALQGEIIGEGINGNKEKIKGKDFYLFRIYDIDASKILGRVERDQVINELRGRGAIINVCPIVEIIKLKVFSARVSAILDYAAGPSLNPKHRREGLVFTSLDGQVHFKVISNKYLLKHGG
jgi:RNA ligase (TIGR02306 family)